MNITWMFFTFACATNVWASSPFTTFQTHHYSVKMPRERDEMPNHGKNGMVSLIGVSERPGTGKLSYAVMSAPLPPEIIKMKQSGEIPYRDFCVKLGHQTVKQIAEDINEGAPEFSPAIESPLSGYSSYRMTFRTKKYHGIVQTASYRGQAVILLMMATKPGLMNEFAAWRNTFRYR